MKVTFYKHNIGEEEKHSILATLDSIFLAMGPRVAEFERLLANYLNVNNVIATSSCTDSLKMLMRVYGIGNGDEVITTPLTFLATSNSIIAMGAYPVFVDVEENTGLIDPEKIEAAITERTKAIMPVHLYGHMCDMKRIKEIAVKHNLLVFEDSAHCVEGKRDQIQPGQLSDGAAFSFYATKNITRGEGGAIACNDVNITEKLRLIRNHGMSKSAADRFSGKFEYWDMLEFGLNYKMTDIQASLLIPQLNKIDIRWQRKEKIARKYEESFTKAGIPFAKTLSGAKNARHLFTIWAPLGKRDKFIKELMERGIGITINYNPVHLTKFYRDHFGYKEGKFPIAERIGYSTVSIPLYPKLKEEEVDYVIQTVIGVYKKL